MILYKYTSLAATRRILGSGRIGFSRPGFFNDPFDTPVAIPVPSEDPISRMFADVGAQGKSLIWEQKTAILSLTRSPSNALMWAHYANGHQGAVLEIRIDVAGFTDETSNMIPAQFGSVVYSRSRPRGPYSSVFKEPISVGATHHFVLSHYEKWQRLFLTKPLDWAYEEEVRVAKCLDGLELCGTSSSKSGDCEIVNVGERPLHCFQIPHNAIRRIFVGARSDKDEAETLAKEYPDVEVCPAVLDHSRFEIQFNS